MLFTCYRNCFDLLCLPKTEASEGGIYNSCVRIVSALSVLFNKIIKYVETI